MTGPASPRAEPRLLARVSATLRWTARIIVARPRATSWTLLAVTAALLAAGLAGLTASHVARWTGSAAPGGASMVVYVGEQVDEARARSLADELAKLPGVERAELVSPSAVAARLQQAVGADSALLEGVDLAGLPSSVEVTLAPGVRDVIAMSPILHALRGTPEIDDVVLEDGGADQATATLHTARIVAWTGAALLAALALIIVLAAIRVRLERAERELAVARLLGASPSFIILPTALAGAVHGAVAALLAAVALAVGFEIYGEAITRLVQGAFGAVEIVGPAVPMVAAFVGIGAVLGLLGGGLAGASRAVR